MLHYASFKRKGAISLKKQINKVREMDVAAIEGSQAMAAGVDRQAIERCKDAVEKLGVHHTPVVGTTQGGKRMLLSGQCELIALRELGVKKMEVIEIDMTDGAGARAKLSLQLMSLKDGPGALCEGMLLQEVVGAGVSRSEIQTMLGKSASWVSNRIALVTRLDDNVYELVKSGLLDPRSAQEVARLPAEVQFAFAEAAVRESLPKSAIEALVAGYNDENCPSAVKAQILSDPRAALKRMTDKRRAVTADRSGREERNGSAYTIDECIRSAMAQMLRLCRLLSRGPVLEIKIHEAALMELETELLSLLTAVRGVFSPGKTEVGCDAG